MTKELEEKLKKMNRDYVWMEVSHDGYNWNKRAIVGKCGNEYKFIDAAEEDDNEYIKLFLSGKLEYHRYSITEKVREIKEPIWKPYPELTEEVKDKLRDKWVINKNSKREVKIIGFGDKKIVQVSTEFINLNDLFEIYTFIDGTQIGIQE